MMGLIISLWINIHYLLNINRKKYFEGVFNDFKTGYTRCLADVFIFKF